MAVEAGLMLCTMPNLIKHLPLHRHFQIGNIPADISKRLIKSIKRLDFPCHSGKFLNIIWCSLPELLGSDEQNSGGCFVSRRRNSQMRHGSDDRGNVFPKASGLYFFELTGCCKTRPVFTMLLSLQGGT